MGYKSDIEELIEKNGWKKRDAEKFTKLIVKQCMGIYDCIDNGNDWEGTEDYLEALYRTFFKRKKRSEPRMER